MILKFMSIQGFKSFKNKQTFNFKDSKSGLFFVTGENLIESGLGANGAGKSAFFSDSLCFLLFGKTSTNLKAGNIKSWNTKIQCKGSLIFDKNGEEYTLTRSWNPNKIELNKTNEETVEVAQEEVEQLINLNFSSFLYSIVVSQFSSKFLDLDPSAKLQVFSDILQLDKWMSYSEKAKGKSQEIELVVVQLNREISRVTGQIESLNDRDFTRQIEEFETQKKLQVRDLKEDLLELGSKKVEVDQILQKVNKKLTDSEQKIGEIKQKSTVLERENTKIEEQIKKVVLEKKEVEVNIQSEVKELRKFEKVEDKCPYCLQKVDEKYLELQLTSIENRIEVLEKEEANLKFNLSEKRKELEVLSKDWKEVEVSLRQITDEVRDLNYEKRTKERDLKEIINKETLTKKEILIKEKEQNPYLKLEEENTTKINHLFKQVEGVERELSKNQQQFEIHKYWIKGFKEVRLFIVEEALQELELHMNNYLNKLGLQEWEIILSVDKETKKGTIRKGFSVYIKSPFNTELVPFECWSGGESQRIRLAGTLGLSSMIKSRKGIDTNIFIIDEPTQWLSNEGVEDLLDVLQDYSLDENIQTYLIDHRDLRSAKDFNKIIKVVKSEEGSRIVIE
jgi:DNA repair exonuclease SbcCD ATPase subunit